ncbi:MAG: beta-propeller domain-containing protein, partial [Jiangellaceae bacterium]
MMTASRSTVLVAGLAGSALALSACTGGGSGGVQAPAGQVAAALRLVSFDSCDDALAELKRAVAEYVSPYGLGGGDVVFDGDVAMAVPEAAAGAERGSLTGGDDSAAAAEGDAAAVPQEHSTTNTHEVGVDEPDLVKTDGRRIVTVTDNTLRVVDAESRTLS